MRGLLASDSRVERPGTFFDITRAAFIFQFSMKKRHLFLVDAQEFSILLCYEVRGAKAQVS